ncbi:hypothetical protein [Mesorhizobium sp. WSM4904]|uniref:hypothetical protein n=1 Tax=Mesorhizobium sp. WSM4904 TaxID=3038545 RepID=UPI00241826BB|nr:hypothetical protein [Mesorhizobium sp. WSM4904]WFP63679.1 hypothetical protein QAZ47_03595 [Mesorhizobium sp. WSM4904]
MLTIHPFPARMSPEFALEKLAELAPKGVVLDPMSGSGTVLRQATNLGHRAIGFDLDPLAVLMGRVWTSPIDDEIARRTSSELLEVIDGLSAEPISIPWIDSDKETSAFVDFWFAEPQQSSLRRISYALNQYAVTARPDQLPALDLARLALSRIIITKERGASLARDVSHSRPHKVADTNDFDVRQAFERSMEIIRKRLTQSPPNCSAEVAIGDARSMASVADSSIDAVLTSPPYLNAIDYLRGHRLSLVWLGHRLADLRAIRSGSIGTERQLGINLTSKSHLTVKNSMGDLTNLPKRFLSMVDRYVVDILGVVEEIARVLKAGGRAIFVVGDSCLRGVFVRNSEAVVSAAHQVGLKLASRSERPLPNQSRYLPMTSEQLAKRMRTETVLTFAMP